MKLIYCDCCNREIYDEEQVFSMEIRKGIDREIVLEDMCIDCYERIKHIVDNADSWRMTNK